MKKSFGLAGILLLLPVFVWAGKTTLLQVRDIWTLRPVTGARAVIAGDTLVSDGNGFFHFPKSARPTEGSTVFKTGYFTETLSAKILSRKIIYLVPEMSTEAIPVIRSREAAQALSLPSNISRLEVRPARNSGLHSIGDLLSGQEGLFIKSYGGSGQLQTISLRGMAAGQTQVLLDGLPLNNLQLGSADLSAYDVDDFAVVTVYRGGNALLDGSAGTVNLLPDSIRRRLYYAAQMRFASFKNESYRLRLDIPLKGLLNSFSFKRTAAQNRYDARDADGRYVHLQNRDFKRWQFNLRNRFNLGRRWSLHGWFSLFKRSGGAAKPFLNAASEQTNVARKSEEVSLAKIKLRRPLKRGQLQAQAFVRNERMSYDDPSYIMNDQALHSNHFNRLGGVQVAARYLPLNNLLLHGGVHWYLESIHSSSAGSHSRERGILFLSGDYRLLSRPSGWLRNAHLNTQLRLERFGHGTLIFLPAMGLNFLTAGGRFYGSLGKNYRAPSFNDLYWQPGGNPRLEAEKSLHGELGYEFTRQMKTFILRIRADIYANKVGNQIKWLPGAEYWSPQNIASVYSRGLEWHMTLSDRNDRNRLTVNYTYGKSEKDKAEFSGDPNVGHQLPFLPREQIFIQAGSAWGGLHLGARVHHASFRYLTLQNDARQVLPAYTTGDIWLALHTDWLGRRWQFGCSLNNLFDLRYQVMAGYPMPPRSFLLSIKLENLQ